MSEEARTPSVDMADYQAVSALFQVLSAPARSAIVHLLSEQEHTVTELVEALGLSQPLVSQHLRVLRDACLVEGHKQGRTTVYRLTDEHVAHIWRDAYHHSEEHSHDDDHRAHHG